MFKDYNTTNRDWSNIQLIDFCQILIHSPHINQEEKEYYKERLKDLTNTN